VVPVQEKSTPGIQSLVRSCPAPLLVTKGYAPEFKSVLLAYDGSPKSEEALFLAAYLSAFWELSLRVITILEKEHNHVNPGTIIHAEEFLDFYGVAAQYQETDRDPVESILKTAQDQGSDLIVLGGYSTHAKTRTKKRILDKILEKSEQAVMVCR
jgi:nucleotide-binding universal stress UspA family protein